MKLFGLNLSVKRSKPRWKRRPVPPVPPGVGLRDITKRPRRGDTFDPVVRMLGGHTVVQTFCSCRRMEAEREGWRDNDAPGYRIVLSHGESTCPTCGDIIEFHGLPHVLRPKSKPEVGKK